MPKMSRSPLRTAHSATAHAPRVVTSAITNMDYPAPRRHHWNAIRDSSTWWIYVASSALIAFVVGALLSFITH